MKFARILNNVAVDVIDHDPVDAFHPDLAAEFAPVPTEVVAGSRLVDGAWIAPEPETAPPAPAQPIQMAIIDFLRLFTQAEMAGFNALRKTVAALLPADYDDPSKVALVGFEVGLTHYEALRAGLIELDHPETIQWLSLLVPLGVLTEARLAEVLAGQAPA
ncbi:hypothetical protein [Brevundimonas sp.]|uniref:hypothetical protein n=2 Tax=Brevundimonas sp. TaxID=1871086 RepID=UPI0028AC44C4|nr:hypothetical protein [Brevundimonas sp.]